MCINLGSTIAVIGLPIKKWPAVKAAEKFASQDIGDSQDRLVIFKLLDISDRLVIFKTDLCYYS